jgi:hypothetical protein
MYSPSQDKLVPHREKPYEANIEGPFYVTDQCIICALPLETAPAIFKWHFTKACGDCPRSCCVAKQPETEEELNATVEAMLHSCVSAIRYRGTDREILDRLVKLGARKLCDAL